jgi:peptide deformylase
MPAMATHTIRLFGDPVLKRPTAPVTDIDGALVKLVDAMFETMYDANGAGLAANQVGVQKRFFVYDLQDGTGPKTIVNPVIQESRGEWVYDEGCLSIPKLYVEILRPKELLVTGYDLEGNELQIEADEILGRVIQHELDHLDGVLMFERMTPDQRKQAMIEWRRLQNEPEPEPKKRRIRLT